MDNCEATIRRCIEAVETITPLNGMITPWSVKATLTAMLPDPVKTLADQIFDIDQEARKNGTDPHTAIAVWIIRERG